MMLYICFNKISHRVSELLSGCDLYTKICKGHNSVKYVDGDMVLILSTMIDDVLYLYQVLSKYLIEF